MLRTAGAVTLWDRDWPKERRLVVSATARRTLLTQLDADLAWLESVRVMDYSFLLGIEPPSAAEPEHEHEPELELCADTTTELMTGSGPQGQACSASTWTGRHVLRGVDGTCLHIGVIDLLQMWTKGKRIEGWAKGLRSPKKHGGNSSEVDEVSAVAPDRYRERVQQWVETIIVAPE
eukprot:COSAG06_NODE_628_length_13649_cov_20.848930_2_plen_177_part_00